MDAFKRSLATEEASAPKPANKPKKPKKAVARQREMLLPIAGKVTEKAELATPKKQGDARQSEYTSAQG